MFTVNFIKEYLIQMVNYPLIGGNILDLINLTRLNHEK